MGPFGYQCVFCLEACDTFCVGVLSVDAVLYVWAGVGHIGPGNRLCS